MMTDRECIEFAILVERELLHVWFDVMRGWYGHWSE